MNTTFLNKLTNFVALIQSEKNASNRNASIQDLNNYAKQNGRVGYYEGGFDEGQKYFRVWLNIGTSNTQKSVAYFVNKETETIYGAKSWKTPNFNRQYGTLDTMNDWDWSNYYGVSKNGVDTLVPKENRKR